MPWFRLIISTYNIKFIREYFPPRYLAKPSVNGALYWKSSSIPFVFVLNLFEYLLLLKKIISVLFTTFLVWGYVRYCAQFSQCRSKLQIDGYDRNRHTCNRRINVTIEQSIIQRIHRSMVWKVRNYIWRR